jgi:hypothetical protein
MSTMRYAQYRFYFEQSILDPASCHCVANFLLHLRPDLAFSLEDTVHLPFSKKLRANDIQEMSFMLCWPAASGKWDVSGASIATIRVLSSVCFFNWANVWYIGISIDPVGRTTDFEVEMTEDISRMWSYWWCQLSDWQCQRMRLISCISVLFRFVILILIFSILSSSRFIY